MIGYIVLAFFVYFLYRFIVGFVLPVVRTATQMKRKVREMNGAYGQGSYNESRNRQNGPTKARVNVTGENKGPFSRFSKQKAAGQAAKPSKSDYIEFEEIN